MKKVLVALAVVALAVPAFAAITDSAHDFSADAWNTGGEICQPCHTPHNAYTFTSDGDGTNELIPLWNHAATASSFTLYTSPTDTLDATLSAIGGVSKVCLSCHDGTVDLDNFGGVDGAANTRVSGAAALGTDLSNDHPVSFAWPTTDSEIKATSTAVTFADSSTGTIDDMLFGGNMECASCHDVHNTVSATTTKLLLKSNAASALCLTCHSK